MWYEVGGGKGGKSGDDKFLGTNVKGNVKEAEEERMPEEEWREDREEKGKRCVEIESNGK